MKLKAAYGGCAIYVNGNFERWYLDVDRAQSYFEFLRDFLPDTEMVDLVDYTTGEILASTVNWKHED